MAGKGDKLKTRRNVSLSKNKKRSGAVNATPITSFFSTPQPTKVSCPLCGQMVPKFGINDHIDLQCKNFERTDSSATSASNIVVSPGKDSSKSSQLDPELEDETTTSPYFKSRTSLNVSREISSKTVVRKLYLGSLSLKISTTCQKTDDRTHSDKHALSDPTKETLDDVSNSQKENLASQASGSNMDSIKAVELTTNVHVTCTTTETSFEKELKTETWPKVTLLSSSKLVKRKKETPTNSKGSSLKKKPKHEVTSSVEAMFGKETGDGVKLNPEMPASVHYDLLSNSDEVAHNSGDLQTVSLPEKNKSDITGDPSPLQRLPYYLRNFRTVLQAVLENDDDRALFNQDDMTLVQTFEKLSVMGQKLYVRLFQRKLKWLQVVKLDYEEICSDLAPVAHELVQGGLLQTENDLSSIEEALDLLPAPELKTLAKTFHLGQSGTQKQQLVDGLLRLSKQKSFFSLSQAQNNIGTVILKRAKQLAGSCVRLCRGPRDVFSRILLLFSLSDTMDEEETAAGGQNQLYTILLVNSGRLTFPDYTVQRMAKVFRDRDDLIRYDASMRALEEVTLAMQAGHWEEALDLYTTAKNEWQDQKMSYDLSHQKELPVFLRSFTTGWAYTRILSRGVGILQRLRRYEEAVNELRCLLLQDVYCSDSRGRWWDRLALNLQQHLKKPEKAIRAIKDGLSDPFVRTGHKLALYQRASRMRESASFKKYHRQLRDLPTLHIQEVRHVTIRGQLFPHEGGTGKSRFLVPSNGDDCTDGTVICSVEDLSLAHYRQQGFDQGIHGEGSTFSTLFALLLWDIIFMDGIPDVFRNLYQACPLDFYTDCFYENRREAIDCRVQLIREASVETLRDILEQVWISQEGKVCSCANWERFSSLSQAQSLACCMGGGFLAGVITRMAKDFRHCRGGLPDLVVWSTSDNSYKLVEVKGPNDRLSQKQQIWLYELQKLGADVEVCHVVATGARGSRVE
ncbi:fanconi-associated nuclease 1 isoform X2 [Syngnathus scovelli]|uniref:fanconi-associated nuclease 1 isoform X2 n=1 Tax=Syngnathus scovelli TaxID=161590 RepID=UPI00210F970F|nr:fanconi-associated nuclease 1 isoform X2 [Syngnathus scovelli]